MNKTYLKVFGAIAVSAATIGLLFAFGDYRVYLAYLARADYWKLWPLAIISPVAQVLRSCRLSLLIPSAPLLDRQLYQVSSMHMLLSAVLPMRAGELALPVMLKLRRNVPMSTGAGFVLVMRVFDLAMVATICGVAAAVVLPQPFWKLLGVAAALGATGGLLLMPISAAWVRRRASRSAGRLWKLIDGLAEGAAVLRNLRSWLLAWCATLLVWIGVFASYYICASTISHIPLDVLVLSGGAASLAVAQPVNGVAGLGPFQAAWAWTANSLGIDWYTAVATGVVIHLGQIGASAFNAAVAQVVVKWPNLAVDTPRAS